MRRFAMIRELLISSLVVSIHAYTYYNCSSCHSFPTKSVGLSLSDVRNILVDEKNAKIYVASKNLLLRLNPSLSSDKSSYEYLDLPPSDTQVQNCINSGNKKSHCANYLRLLMFDNDNKVFTCGTYATKPRCWRIQRTGKLVKLSVIDNGNTISPKFPDQNVSGVITNHPVKNGYLFTGLNIDPGTRSSGIFREAVNNSIDKSFLKTSDLLLKDANFVSSYAAPDNFVYFFWREKAIESQNMEVYSRVGRVCSYDKGGKKNVFTSFTKSRLSCAVPGKEQFAYNHLQSTFKYMESSIYGIFTTPESGLAGSAVCVFSLQAIQSVFSTSDYLEEVQMDDPASIKSKVWKSVPPPKGKIPGRPQCNASLNTKAYGFDTITFANSHPLLSESVKPMTGKPLIVMPNIRFTHIAVDNVKTLIGGAIKSIPVMFLASDNGTIYKVADITPDKKTKIVEQINVFNGERPIRSLRLYKNSLYVGCSAKITKASTHRCSNKKTCRSCVELQDPYCGWSENQCTTKDAAGSSSWIQDVVFGKFDNVCPEEPPTCSLKLKTNNPGGTTVLECSMQGIPVPAVTKWQFNGQQVQAGSDYTIEDLQYSQRLSVHKFGLENLGDYQCTVQNNKGQSHTCKLSIKGTLPVVSSGFFKTSGQTYFWCNAKGIPKPTVRQYKVVRGLVQTVTTSVNEDSGPRSYYCIAQNKFGPSVGENFTLKERKIDVKITLIDEDWDKDLKDSETSKYKSLSERVKTSIASVYSNNTSFMETTKVTFSKGSVVANVELRFACKSYDTDVTLLDILQEAIFSGKLGTLKVEKSSIIKNYTQVPTPGYRIQAQGMDTGLFVVAILVAIVLSVIVGFFLGIKFRRQALSSCGPKKHDSSIQDDKDIQSLRYTKSPTFDNSQNCTDEKLLKKKDGDGDSVGSTGGRIHIIIDPSKTPENKVLVNGKIPKSC